MSLTASLAKHAGASGAALQPGIATTAAARETPPASDSVHPETRSEAGGADGARGDFSGNAAPLDATPLHGAALVPEGPGGLMESLATGTGFDIAMVHYGLTPPPAQANDDPALSSPGLLPAGDDGTAAAAMASASELATGPDINAAQLDQSDPSWWFLCLF